MKHTTDKKTERTDIFKKHGRKAMLALLLCLLVVGVYLINAVFYQLSQRYSLSIDLTANAAYEVGPETKDLLGSLSKDVDIYVLARPDAFGGNSYFMQMQHILELYPKLSDNVTLSYIDFAYDPTFASRFPQFQLQQGDILVVCGDNVKQLHFSQMFNYYQSETGDLTLASSRAEEALTSAFVYVMSENQINVAVITGNGVADVSSFTALLTDNNYIVSSINIATDVLDGYIARKYNLVTSLGKIADPLADKLMQITALIILSSWGLDKIPIWLIAIILAKEILLGVGAIILYKQDNFVVSANWYGKMVTVVFYLAIIMLIFDKPFGSWMLIGKPFNRLFFLLAVLAALFAFFMYVRSYLKIKRNKGGKLRN
jgi:cardiolipin synthase